MPYIQNSFLLCSRISLLPAVFVFSEKEVGAHDIRLRFIDVGGTELIKPIEGKINIGQPANGQYSAVNLVFNFNQLKFDKAGRYSFELYIDDEWESGLPLFINQVS